MKIESYTKKQGHGQAGQMVMVSHQEALTLIKSLTHQMINNYENAGRAEFDADNVVTGDRDYFSIAVEPEDESNPS